VQRVQLRVDGHVFGAQVVGVFADRPQFGGGEECLGVQGGASEAAGRGVDQRDATDRRCGLAALTQQVSVGHRAEAYATAIVNQLHIMERKVARQVGESPMETRFTHCPECVSVGTEARFGGQAIAVSLEIAKQFISVSLWQ